jgi:hypothetical protein
MIERARPGPSRIVPGRLRRLENSERPQNGQVTVRDPKTGKYWWED